MKLYLPILSLVVGLNLTGLAAPKHIIPVISLTKDGHLTYSHDSQGNQIPDFSTCGYAGGDQIIPNAPVKMVVTPESGDETERIQQAIGYVGALPPDTNGLRGAVLLLSGRHEVGGSLLLDRSGVVLRGQGSGIGGTVLVATGSDRRTLIRAVGRNDLTIHTGAWGKVTCTNVPVGACQIPIADASGVHPGDTIRIVRPGTTDWIENLGMNEFGGGLGDWRLVWHPASFNLVWDRVVKQVTGNEVTVDAPITTALEQRYGGGRVEGYSWPGRLSQVGVENLRLESAFNPDHPGDENHSWFAVTLDNTMDAWVRQVSFNHFAGSAVAVYETCKRVTVQDCLSLAPVSEIGGWRRDSFFTTGQQVLFLRCWAEHGHHDFAVGQCAAGPNAFVQCEDTSPSGDSGATGAWASGTLFDNVRIDGNGLNLMNRGDDGEGAGWSAANSVLWQCDASRITCENPPGAHNWALGCWGEFAGNGVWRDANASIKPYSLFVAQVADRLGRSAADKVPLMQRSSEEYSNPSPAQAAKLDAASRLPAPQLADYIAQAAQRDPIPAAPGDAPSAKIIPLPILPPPPSLRLALTNGWLTCDGRLLTGGMLPVNWWRGNMRPAEANDYGVNVTRFAPGRVGAGFTDDLDALAASMVANHQAALNHHYGLWYDRRREDHERVRRIDGEVWAPFYEQPFARSGQGTAWDGLSKYDLTQYNPWYWSRLQQFAQICERHGLVLFNNNYFQHNIIEAGAHWVDCPWRSANNLNGTGFPEPPPFAGDKRIFMATQFYDVNQPVRRHLHELFIRQNLNNFSNEPNVIQFTSAEFTGPTAFEQFWLDTIGQWQHETGRHPLVALAAPKNVQDAILADPARAAVVDVICFRYWWQTDGELFAPPGGQNLSPRQSERKWKGGTPRDGDLAQMAATYRDAHPDKAVIAAGEDEVLDGSWAFLCAGGSMPDLPVATEQRLLRAIPHMQVWVADSEKSLWALREPGQQILVSSEADEPAVLDLTAETGVYQVHPVDPRSGRVGAARQTVTAGAKVTVPPGVNWLTRD